MGPDRRWLVALIEVLFERRSGVARGDSACHGASLRGESVPDAMEQELQQCGAVEAILQLWPLHEMGGSGALDRGIDLGGIKVEVVGELEIRGAIAFRERELEEHDDVERLQHMFMIARSVQYSNKLNISTLRSLPLSSEMALAAGVI